MPALKGDSRRLAHMLKGLLNMHHLSINEHFIGLSFERTVAEVHTALLAYVASVKASYDARVAKITKLIEETKSEGSDADVVITWTQKNLHTWGQTPMRPKMKEMLTEATFAGLERGLVAQLGHLVEWLAVDVAKAPERVLDLRQSDMSMFRPYDSDTLRGSLPFIESPMMGIGAVAASRFGGNGYDNFRELAASTATQVEG